MHVAAPYREQPRGAGEPAALPSPRRVITAIAAVALATVVLGAPVIALAMQPFSTVATLVAGSLAAVAAASYGRIYFDR